MNIEQNIRPLGLGHFTFLDLPPIELVKLAGRSGFDAVGLRFHPIAPGQLHWLPDNCAMHQLAHVLDGEGITLYVVEAVVIDSSLEPASLIPMMDAAAALGARRINTCADRFDALVEHFTEICDLAAARGLGVDLECMAWRGINTPGACLELIDASGASNAGYLVDALHHTRCGGTPEDLANIDPIRLVSAQLCDAPNLAPEGKAALLTEAREGRQLPGDGGLPLAAVLDALPTTTVLSVEIPSRSDDRAPDDRARAIHAATRELLAGPPG